MRILSIGNSFSQDAHAYLHKAASGMGLDIECYNLYIGGCSLETHANNLKNDSKAYTPELNGIPGNNPVSINEALSDGEYDVITLQQASHFSGKYETYFPYLREVYDACVKAQPKAKIYLHETWAYETDSNHSAFPDYNRDQKLMYSQLNRAYNNAAEELGVSLIPVGGCVEYFRNSVPEFDYAHGGISLNRDGFHLSIPIGRLLAAYVWIEKLTGGDVRKSNYIPDGCDDKTAALIPMVRENVHRYMEMLK